VLRRLSARRSTAGVGAPAARLGSAARRRRHGAARPRPGRRLRERARVPVSAPDGCVVAFAAYAAPVPGDALFGRTVDPSLEVLCTNPAALGGGSGALTAIFATRPFAPSVIGTGMQASGAGLPRATPWTAFTGRYTARCSNAAGPSVLEVTAVPGARPIPALPDARWGLHLADANVALGTRADRVRRQIAASAARN
jgi:hypothetical protein